MKLYSFHKIATGYLKKRDRKIRKGRQEGGRTERRRQEREKEALKIKKKKMRCSTPPPKTLKFKTKTSKQNVE